MHLPFSLPRVVAACALSFIACSSASDSDTPRAGGTRTSAHDDDAHADEGEHGSHDDDLERPRASGGSAAGHGGAHADPDLASAEATDGPIPEDCRGFSFEGLKYSPGGEALPNTCAPFHPTLNNPFAVRCVDVWPWYETEYAGDEYCILPPPPDKGIQIGFHPQGAAYFEQVSNEDMRGYDGPGKDWLVEPGGEQTTSYRGPATNVEGHKYYRTYFRMRTGSHHNIISMHETSTAEGWLPARGEALPGLFDPSAGALRGILGGQERPDDSTPVTLTRPPEDEGLYLSFPAKPSIFYNVHFFNVSKKPVLKEGWVNVWWEETGTQLISWFMGMELSQPLTLAIAPGQTRDLHYSYSPRSKVRMVRFFGHRHVWTPNFSAWIQRKNGDVDVMYQSFDWMDMPTYRYDSIVQNPRPNNAKRTDGAMSGIVTLEAGDKLHFNCHITYTEERAAEHGAPSPRKNGTLRFANQALTAEMCIGYGNVTGGSLGPVSADTSLIPDVVR
ncbi:MAG: hypothetical protein ABW252_22855 [Polyangiales bacterium]